MLHITGWYDSWTRQVTMNYEALSRAKKSPQRLVIGPWVHGARARTSRARSSSPPRPRSTCWHSACDGTTAGSAARRTAWTTIRPVLLYVMGTGDDRRSAAGRLQHGGFWRAEREWPIARARPMPLYLHADGSSSGPPPLSRARRHTRSTRDNPVPTIGGNISSNQGLMTSGGYDQRPRDDTHAAGNRLPLSERRDVLVFRTAPLEADLEVTGTVEVKLWISSTAPDTDFTAKLIDEIPPNPGLPARAST